LVGGFHVGTGGVSRCLARQPSRQARTGGWNSSSWVRWRTVAQLGRQPLATGWSDMLSHGTPPGVLLNLQQRGCQRRWAPRKSCGEREQSCGHQADGPRTRLVRWVSHGNPSGFCSAQNRHRRLLRHRRTAGGSSRWNDGASGTCGDRPRRWMVRWRIARCPPEVNLQRLRPAVDPKSRATLGAFVGEIDAACGIACQTGTPTAGVPLVVARRLTKGGLMGSPAVVPARTNGWKSLWSARRALWHRGRAERSQRRVVPPGSRTGTHRCLHYCRQWDHRLTATQRLIGGRAVIAGDARPPGESLAPTMGLA